MTEPKRYETKAVRETGFSVRFWAAWLGISEGRVRQVLSGRTAGQEVFRPRKQAVLFKGKPLKKLEAWRVAIAKENGVAVESTYGTDSREEYLFYRCYMKELKRERNCWASLETSRGRREWVVCGRKRKEWRKAWEEKRKRERHPAWVAKRIRFIMAKRMRAKVKTALTGTAVSVDGRRIVEHIQSKFQKGMSWKNWGTDWHIDHIVPLCKFDLSNTQERKRANHYTNLQPLWAKDNLRKGAKCFGEVALIAE